MTKRKLKHPLRLTEHDKMCAEIVTWGNLCLGRYPFLYLLRHWPNEGKRDPRLAHAVGIKAGPSDFLLPVPSPKHRQLWLEVKKTGDIPTQSQLNWFQNMEALGDFCFWSDDLNKIIQTLDVYCHDALSIWMKQPTLLPLTESLL